MRSQHLMRWGQTRTLKPEHASVQLSGRDSWVWVAERQRGVMNNEWIREMCVNVSWWSVALMLYSNQHFSLLWKSSQQLWVSKRTWAKLESKEEPSSIHPSLGWIYWHLTQLCLQTHIHTYEHIQTDSEICSNQPVKFVSIWNPAQWVPKDFFVWPIWVKSKIFILMVLSSKIGHFVLLKCLTL